MFSKKLVLLCSLLLIISLVFSQQQNLDNYEENNVVTINSVRDVIKAFKSLKVKKDLFIRSVLMNDNKEAKELANLISNVKECPIRRFLITKNKKTSDEFLKIVFSEGLAQNNKIEVVGLTRTNISEPLAKVIGESLKKMKNLKKIYFYKNFLNEKTIKLILQNGFPLEKIVIIDNPIGDSGLETVINFVNTQKTKKIYELVLRDIKITEKGGKLLKQFFQNQNEKNSKLQKVDLSENKLLKSEGISEIFKGLSKNQIITHFDLAYCPSFDTKNIKIFANEILLNEKTKLLKIDLSENKMGDDSIKLIADSIKQKSKCKNVFIDLSNNKITDKGVNHLLQAMQENTKFSHLAIYRTEIKDKKLKEQLKKISDRIKSDFDEGHLEDLFKEVENEKKNEQDEKMANEQDEKDEYFEDEENNKQQNQKQQQNNEEILDDEQPEQENEENVDSHSFLKGSKKQSTKKTQHDEL